MLSFYTTRLKRLPSTVLSFNRTISQISRPRRTSPATNRLKITHSTHPKTFTRPPGGMADDLREDAQDASLLELEDKIQGSSSRGRSDRGRGKGRGGGGQGREVQVSKALSKLLRHQAGNAGIQLDDEGFAPLDSVLAWGPLRSIKVTLDDVQSIVASNDKQRFTLKPNPKTNPSLSTTSTSAGDYLIRANQGHSIKLESSALMAPITVEAGNVPDRVLHGTFFYFWPRIVETSGLKPMNRNHVHCSTGTPEEGVVSGMRRDAEVIIEIDIEASLKEGVKWWLSDNGVLLTEGDEQGILSSRFFKLVTGRTVDVGVLWQDGEKIADLPSNLKVRPPFNKGPRGGGRGGRRGGGS